MSGVSVTIGTKGLSSLDALKAKADSTAKGIRASFSKHLMGGWGATAFAAAGAGLVLAMRKSITAASDLIEMVGKTEDVFGKSSAEMIKWADTAAKSFGQSKTQALEAASTIGNLFVAMDMAPETAAKMSRSLVELASDLASFNNAKDIQEVLVAIGAGLRGETEPMLRFGVSLDEASLKQRALTMGMGDGVKTLTQMQKVMAAYSIILDKTKTAQGNFDKTSTGLANSQRTIKAQMEDTAATIGEKLEPFMRDLANQMVAMDWDSTADGLSVVASGFLTLANAAGVAGSVFKTTTYTAGVYAAAIKDFMSGAKSWHNAFADAETVMNWQNNPAAKPTPKKAGGKPPQEAAGATVAERKAAGEAADAQAAGRERTTEEAKKANELEAERVKSNLDRAAALQEIRDSAWEELGINLAMLEGDKERVKELELEAAIRQRIRGLIAEGADEVTATTIADLERQKAVAQSIAEIRGKQESLQFQSTIGGATSMQRVGGGGGAFSSGLDYAKQANDLQRQMLTQLQLIGKKLPTPETD